MKIPSVYFAILLFYNICTIIPVCGLEFDNCSTKFNFILPAIKHSRRHDQKPFCATMNSSFIQTTNELIFKIDIQDKLSKDTNFERFGGTSDIRGKQSINFVLKGLDSKDLFRQKRKLRNGITKFQIDPKQEKRFEICFFNYIYDGSWNSHDIDKFVTLEMTKRDFVEDEAAEFIKQNIRSNTNDGLLESTLELSEIIDKFVKQDLLDVEKAHRNLNESTFEWLLYGLTSFTIVVIGSNILIIWYIRKQIKKRKRIGLIGKKKYCYMV